MVKSKKERVLLLILIILSAITIGIVRADTKNIVLDNIAVKDKSGTIVVDPSINGNSVTSNVIFNQKDDYVTFEVTLRNKEELSYKIESISDNNTNENIGIEYKFSEDYIEADQMIKITIKLSYKSKLINKEQVSLDDLTITVHMLCEDDDEEKIIIFPITGNETQEEQGIENPTTKDSVICYVLIVMIASVGLALIRIKRGKQGAIKTIAIVMTIILVPVLALVLARESYSIPIKFTGIVVKGEFETYNIIIDQNNDNELIVREIKYGDTLGELPANPTKKGYNFTGWKDDKGNEVSADTVITGPIEVEAQYDIIEYGITYNLDGGHLPSGKSNPDKYTVETETFDLVNPEKAGYTFTGWTGTEIDTKTTSVTIEKDSIGDREYTANFSANTETPYTVIHKYQNLEDPTTYTENTITEYGETDTEVTAPLQGKTGFVTPDVQTVKINGDESSSVTYTYNREKYAFSISNRTYIDNEASTADDEYLYGTTITAKANPRQGYDFRWNDNEASYERSFVLEEATTLTPVYIARTDTAYKVKHMKQKSSLDGYELANEQNLTGTTDSSVAPAVNTYIGYNSPSAQTVTIAGDGSTVVTYYYDIKMLTLTVNENVNVSVVKPSYPYGTQITVTAKEVADKEFVRWSNNVLNNPYTFTIKENTTLEPIYKMKQVTVTFDADGGSEVPSQTFDINQKATKPADPTKDGNFFIDWYIDDTTVFDFSTAVRVNTTLHARWVADTNVVEMNGVGYPTVQEAINAAGTTPSTIRFLKNQSEVVTVAAGQNIILDLNEKTLSNNGNKNVISNSGELKVTNGTITTNQPQAAINNNEGATVIVTFTNLKITVANTLQAIYSYKATAIVGEGTVVESHSTQRAAVQNFHGTLVLDGAHVSALGGGRSQAVYNDGGTTEIKGSTYLYAKPRVESSNERGAAQSINGTLIISGGTIVSDNYGVTVTNGSLRIGTQNSTYNAATPEIRGGTSAVNSVVNYSIYDGIMEGKDSAVRDESKINATESGFTKVNGEKTIDSEIYQTLYYEK